MQSPSSDKHSDTACAHASSLLQCRIVDQFAECQHRDHKVRDELGSGNLLRRSKQLQSRQDA